MKYSIDMQRGNIKYPYLPEGRKILYIPLSNEYMKEAKKFAQEHSLDKVIQTGSVMVKDGEIIGKGANGSTYHETHECERVKQKMPTGQGYELCEGCHPKNHSEPKAIANAKENGKNTEGADLYLWGHWWCCEPCWNAMISAGIRNVYLLEESGVLFNKENPNNIIGKQFE